MRRSEMETAANIAPGLYLVDGEPGDPDGIVKGGPYPSTDAGRREAQMHAERIAAVTRKTVTITEVLAVG